MALEEVGVKLTAQGEEQFEAAIRDTEKALEKLDSSVRDLEETTRKGAGFRQFGLSLTDIRSGIELVSTAAKSAARVIEQGWEMTGEATVKYAEQVRDLNRISGTGAEQTSRLIQTADDLKIEYQTLEQAARSLAQKGIALTTEELAKSSDEYLALTDAGERAEYAVKKFGRAGLELTKVLETGGDAIRKMAASQNESLILTDAQVEKAREFEKAQDALNDTLMGFKIAIGNAILPSITSFLRGIEALLTAEEKLKDKGEEVNQTALAQAKTYGEYVQATKKAAEANGMMIDSLGNLGYEAVTLRDEYGNVIETTFKVVKANAVMTEGMWNLFSAQQEVTWQTDQLASATDGAAEAAKFLQNEQARSKQNAERLAESMKALTLEMLYNKAAAGLDADAALALARSMGLLNEDTYYTLGRLQELRAKYDSNRDGAISAAEGAEQYRLEVEALARGVALLKDKTIHIKVLQEIETTYTGGGSPFSGGIGQPKNQQRASGGPVEAGQPYLVGERGPELMIPDVNGVIMPNSLVNSLMNLTRAPSTVYNTTNINYNLGVTTSNSPAAVQRSFAMMQLLAG